jgi:SAM-dependent methyltransferase
MHAVHFFSSTAEDFHASYKSAPNRLERVNLWRDFLERYGSGGGVAYDIGCGSGAIACELAKLGMHTIAIDGSQEMLSIGRENAGRMKLANLEFRQYYLPIANTEHFAKADIVTASSIIEYLDSLPSSLSFLYGLLKPEGTLIFSIPNRHSLSRKLVRSIYRITGKPEYFGLLKHFVTVDEINAALTANGFSLMEYAYCDRSDWINHTLSCFLSPEFSSNMFIVAARKRKIL